jgi:hypothetical protein
LDIEWAELYDEYGIRQAWLTLSEMRSKMSTLQTRNQIVPVRMIREIIKASSGSNFENIANFIITLTEKNYIGTRLSGDTFGSAL